MEPRARRDLRSLLAEGRLEVGHAIDITVRPRWAVFALGCVLWEMLVGRPLFKGTTDWQSLNLARAAHVPPLPDAPPELEAIVRKALARDPSDRYQTAGQLADALASYLETRVQN